MSATKLIRKDNEKDASFLEISFAALFSDGFPFAWYWYSIHGGQRRRVVACSIRRTACNLSIQHLGLLSCCLDLKTFGNLHIQIYIILFCYLYSLLLPGFKSVWRICDFATTHPLSNQTETSVSRLGSWVSHKKQRTPVVERALPCAFQEFPRVFGATPDFQTKRIKKIERWLRSLRLMLRDIWFDSFQ